ncbi:MAG: hypothetical protein ABW186_10975 [Rhodanobacteraceae bacterium]
MDIDGISNGMPLRGLRALRVVAACAVAVASLPAHAASEGNADSPRWLMLDTLAEDPVPAFGSQFGSAVDLDGDVLVIGAPHFQVDDIDAGAAHVYRLVGGSWELEATLTSTEPQHGANFGFAVSVAVTPEREVLVVGESTRDDGAAADIGAISIYEHEGNAWVRVARFTDENSMWLGYAVDTDGTNVIAGAPATNAFFGATLVYRRDTATGTWAFDHDTRPAGGDEMAGYYGISVALNGDLALTGAMAARVANQSVGAAEISSLYEGGPLEERIVVHAQEAAPGDEFGRSVAASGASFVVGAPGAEESPSVPNSGVVYVFRRSNGQLHLDERLHSILPQENARFGMAVAVADDFVVVGEPARTVFLLGSEFQGAGAISLFARDGWGIWDQETAFYNFGVNEAFGAAVAIDGTRAMAGMPRHGAGAASYVERDTVFVDGFQDTAPE